MGGEDSEESTDGSHERAAWDSWRGAECSDPFGRLPRDVLVTAWFVAFVPVVAVFFIWLALYARSNSGNQDQSYRSEGGPGIAITYSAPFQGITEYPATSDAPQPASSSPTADPTSEATAVDSVLRQTASDRKAAAAAVTDLTSCGASTGLSGDVQALQAAQSDRTSLVNQLQNDPVDQLEGGSQAVQLLEAALQDSATADGDYAQAAQDFSANPNSCTADHVTQDTHFQAGQNEDTTATADKTSFTAAWNPIAQQYGLQLWDQGGF